MTNVDQDPSLHGDNRYESLYSSSPDAILTLEPPSWKISAANHAALQIFKINSEVELTKYEPWQLSPQFQPNGRTSKEAAEEMIKLAIDNGATTFEWEHQRTNGESFLSEVRLLRFEQNGKIFLHEILRDIAESKKSEEATKDYDTEKFKAVFDNAHDGMVLIDAKTQKFSMSNIAFAGTLGYTKDEVDNLTINEIHRNEDLPRILGYFQKQLMGELSIAKNISMKRKDGSIFFADISYSPIMIGEKEYVLGIVRDITQHKESEARIQRMTQLYSTLSKGNRAIVRSTSEQELFPIICQATVESGGMVTAWIGIVDESTKNIKIAASYGLGTEYINAMQLSIDTTSAFGNGPSSTSIRESRPVWCQDYEHDPMTQPWHEQARKVGWRSEATLPLLRAGVPIGNIALYSDKTNAFDDDAQKLLIELSADINFALDNFSDKEKLQNSVESLRQVQLIVDNSYDAIIGETLDGYITHWNNGAERMFGYSFSEMKGKSASLLLPAELQNEIPILLNKIRAGEIIADYDSVMLRKDGTRIDVGFSGSPIKARDGTVTGVSVVERDITVRKEAERHIKDLDEVRNKFISIISHQLGTPLTALNWNLESVLNGDFGKLEDVTHKFLQVTHKSSIDITTRIHDLLTAMDIEEGRLVYKKEEVALDSVIAAEIEKMKTRCALKNISLISTLPEHDLPNIEADATKLRTVIGKILENAVVYTNDEGTISTRLSFGNGKIHFEVTDTGIGIPPQEQHHVFTRFFRASNASIMQPDSFGLGLFLAKSIIEQHGGSIGFSSTEGKGSTFWFEIPTSRV